MEPIVPYLTLNGNAAEAMDFYAQALGGQVAFSQTYGESPMETEEAFKDKIMHATLQAGGLTMMFSDGMPGQLSTSGTNLSLSLNFSKVEDIERTFNALTDGATITMPLQDTFWGAKFGMLTDKFGINWMFNHDYEKKEG